MGRWVVRFGATAADGGTGGGMLDWRHAVRAANAPIAKALGLTVVERRKRGAFLLQSKWVGVRGDMDPKTEWYCR